MSDKQVREYDKFMLRLPDGMRNAVAEQAKRNGRSMNSEIVQILQDALDGPSADAAFAVLLNKMNSWYQGVAPFMESIKDLNDEQLKELADEIEKRKSNHKN